ncbi:MAG: leucyl/phenylalanyl-tRNA--protein transferase [Zoogloeaceae bacterium]|jgi:leucyl/phenylalanyl-tRNA--protein transferase|nr:leucyl/phenylalanyl-tRNA--protein transferase [Zoogloeaceae bacterium]
MIPWIAAVPGQPPAPFPPSETALRMPNGLLCAGGDLSPERLLSAYRQGIFPWYSEGEPILWWTPDPRMVLFPAEFRCSRSLRHELAKSVWRVRMDSDFAAVIAACARTPRPGQAGTWIVPAIERAYTCLHELGWAHSVEVWELVPETGEERLAGGLYGVAIGRMFYGESMFTRQSNASKIAFAHLVSYLRAHGFGMIDCQMRTAHLASLGAREIPRADFLAHLERLTNPPTTPGPWHVEIGDPASGIKR